MKILLFLLFSATLAADFVMQQTLIFSITPINQMGQITGPSPVFYLQGADCKTCENTYSISTNEDNKKISAFLDSDMPSGTSLSLNLSPPTGARSMGPQQLSTTPVDLVIELSRVSQSGLPMRYTLESTVGAGVVPSSTRIVTFTMTDG